MTTTIHTGLVGLGTMGSALALNIAEKGFPIAVWNRSFQRARDFKEEAGELADKVFPSETLEAFVDSIQPPRTIIMMLPAGPIIDQQIEALLPFLDPDDLLVDGGNANFHDTNRRAETLSQPFMGIGVSGGEEGARHGPSMMAGGSEAHWSRIAPLVRAISARYEGEPCADWLGESGAGHFVKTVHNGIEYADMQLIAEVYGLQRDGQGQQPQHIGECFARWNEGLLSSYLIGITAEICQTIDVATQQPLLDVIVDAAGQKGTGRWTAIEAQQLGAAVPTVEAAVMARNLSARRALREQGEQLFGQAEIGKDGIVLSEQSLDSALIAGKILCYAQGFEMMLSAAESYGWALPLPRIAAIWRAGCIIRSAMLDDMSTALAEYPQHNLIFTPWFAEQINQHIGGLRETVTVASAAGLPVPAFAASLAYFDTLRQARGTANLVQAQRDFFGLHGFVRLDSGESDQHGPWYKD